MQVASNRTAHIRNRSVVEVDHSCLHCSPRLLDGSCPVQNLFDRWGLCLDGRLAFVVVFDHTVGRHIQIRHIRRTERADFLQASSPSEVVDIVSADRTPCLNRSGRSYQL